MKGLTAAATQVEKQLQHYEDTGVYMKNLEDEITEKELLLRLQAVPSSARLTLVPSSVHCDASQEEREAIYREQLAEQVQGLQTELQILQIKRQRLERALEALNHTDRTIVEGRFFYPRISWQRIGIHVNLSEGYCRRRLANILERLAVMVYGARGTVLDE